MDFPPLRLILSLAVGSGASIVFKLNKNPITAVPWLTNMFPSMSLGRRRACNFFMVWFISIVAGYFAFAPNDPTHAFFAGLGAVGALQMLARGNEKGDIVEPGSRSIK
jgi:hypothetical protein